MFETPPSNPSFFIHFSGSVWWASSHFLLFCGEAIVNQKKCPKCGENNPAEAVMCWACYTPLSGAPVASGPIPGSTPAPGQASEKKPIAPWQIGVIGLALLIAAGFGISTLVGGAPPNDTGMGGNIIVEDPGTRTPQTFTPPSNTNVPPPEAPQSPGTNQPQPTQVTVPTYTVTTQPDKRWSQATVGIVPAQGTMREQDAARLAAGLGRKLRGPWRSTHIYVFADQQTANTFQQFQRNRDGKPLDANDYAQLNSVWPNTLVRYEINGRNESVRYPKSNPNGWWAGAARRG
jgi:hypothetical protein